MGKCLILSRVSTISQDLEQQTEQLVKEANNRGFSNDDIIIVEDKESAIKLEELERNTLNQMKKHIENDDVQCVFIWEITRLSRQLPMLYSLRDYLQANHVQLYCHTPEFKLFDDNWTISQASNIVFALYAVMAESEMQIKKERFARGKAKKKAEGKFVGGKILFGYTVDSENRFIIHEENATIIKRIFNLYLSGQYSARQIATLLYKEGTISQMQERTRETFVCKTLKNRTYLGTPIYKQIISEDDFNKAQELLARYQIKPRRTYSDKLYYGHKLLFIKDSSRQMMVRKSDAAYIEPVSGFCISMNMVDSLLLHCSDYAYKQHGLGDYEKLQEKYEDELKSLNKRIVNYDKEEEKIRKSIDKLETRIIYGKISEEAAQSISTKLEEDLKNVSVSRKEDLNLRSSLEKSLEAIQRESGKEIDVYSMTDKEQYDFIRGEIAKVEVMRVKNSHYLMMVIYKNPLIDGQIYSIYSKKHKFTLYDEDVDVKFIKRFESRK